MRKFILATFCLLLVTPLAVVAQTPTFDPSLLSEDSALLKTFTERDACFSAYEYGGVHFELGETDHLGIFAPQATVAIKGKVVNDKDYVLPQGRIIVRVLKHDEKFAPKNWHTYVADTVLDGDYGLAAKGSRDFSFDWKIPGLAPVGTYQLDFFYLAGNRYVMSGIPYVANMPGKSLLFDVMDAGSSVAAAFDRNSIELSGNPLELRAVPPTLPADQSVTATVPLLNEAKETTPIKISKALYKWSDSDMEDPLVKTEAILNVAAGDIVPVTFEWPKPAPGVYELVLNAEPLSGEALPSVIKIRFGIEGNMPRIIFAGITSTDKDKATITTCTVNGTFTAQKPGSVATTVSVNGQPIKQTQKDVTDTSLLFTSKLEIQSSELTRGRVTVLAEAKNENGEVTDSHAMEYPQINQKSTININQASIVLLACIILGALASLTYFFITKRKNHAAI